MFREGETAVRRDTFRGKVWSASPTRVVRDADDLLVLACWPGTVGLAPTTWIESLNTRNETIRKQAIPNLAAGEWELGRWTWRDTVRLRQLRADTYFSVELFFEARSHRPNRWSVNFEMPYRRTGIGIDTFDLFLDLHVDLDLSSWSWKDEDEYSDARRAGLISDAVHARVQEARGQVLTLLETRQGPFAEEWLTWRTDPAWPTPLLHPETLEIPAPEH